jgi:hypothetical protein
VIQVSDHAILLLYFRINTLVINKSVGTKLCLLTGEDIFPLVRKIWMNGKDYKNDNVDI